MKMYSINKIMVDDCYNFTSNTWVVGDKTSAVKKVIAECDKNVQ